MDIGWPTGNGKKLSCSQAHLGQQHAWLLLSFFPFPVGHPMSAGCKLEKKNESFTFSSLGANCIRSIGCQKSTFCPERGDALGMPAMPKKSG